MADHLAPGRATSCSSAEPSTPRPPGTVPAEPSVEDSAGVQTLSGFAAAVGLTLGVRMVVAALALGTVVASAVVVAGAVAGTSQAATDLTAQATQAARVSQVPLSARPGQRSAAALAASRRRAVSRDSARRVQVARADRRLERRAEAKADARQAALATIQTRAAQRSAEIVRNTWVRPIAGGYRLTARFGQCSGLWSACHTGLDFAAPSGTPIHSIAAGRVTGTGFDGAYGNKTVVTLEDGTELWYCHQESIEVGVGDTVTPGQQIGTVGSTGNSTGPHLHLEVHPGAGDPVDPGAALAEHGITP